jgi:quercetin dioxygenase-like cupin family protein
VTKRVLCVVAGVFVLALSGCSSQGAPPQGEPASVTASPQASSTVLLDQADRTVLGQPLAYPSGTAEVSSSIVTLPPHAQTGRHRHLAPMYAYVLEGAVTVSYDDGTEKVLSAGSALIEAQDVWHNGRNDGDTDVRILVVNLGADGLVNTEKAK